ncbi:MAG: NAD-dependent epimerase/dehydratase family protein [Nitrospirae bacterium]|nr:NAD-dependent epimerase/dehydratase family protein [Nitrospirota bacterium]
MNDIDCEAYKGKVILVTGGAGAIGTNLCTSLADLGAGMVIILDDLSSGYIWNIPRKKNIMFVKGCVTDDIYLKRVFFEQPKYVFHLAALFANQNSVDYPEKDLNINGFGTLKLLEYSLFNKIDRFVFASSGCSVYGGQAPLPLKEDFLSFNLNTPYQITKALGEMYCNYFKNYYGLKIVKTRFFNSYGPGEVPGQYRNVIPNFIYWAMKREALPITGTGEETRDFTYVGDIVDGLMRVGYCDSAIGEEFNLATGQETTIFELANMINDVVGNDSGIKFVNNRKWDTRNKVLASIDKAKSLIGYTPKVKLDEGLKNTIQWFKNNWNCIERSASFMPGISSSVRDR